MSILIYKIHTHYDILYYCNNLKVHPDHKTVLLIKLNPNPSYNILGMALANVVGTLAAAVEAFSK